MKLFVLYHPFSGNGRAEELVNTLITTYPQVDFVWFRTAEAGDETRLVKMILTQFDESTDRFLIIGGDGTLSKTLAAWPREYPFAYLPAGSGNDFARSLSGLSVETVMSALLLSKKRSINVLEGPQGVVVNSLDLGYAAMTVRLAEGSRLKSGLNRLGLGRLTYILCGVRALFLTRPIAVEVSLDGQTDVLTNLFFCSVANNTYFGGGVTIWPSSHVTREELLLVTAEHGGLFGNLLTVLSLLTKRHEKSRKLQVHRGQTITLKLTDDIPIQMDGEVVQFSQLTLTCHRRFIYG